MTMLLEEAVGAAWTVIDGILAGVELQKAVIGLGSGTTIIPFITALPKHRPQYTSCTFIPTSRQSKQLLDKLQLRCSDLNAHSALDVCVDGCDLFEDGGDMIKGGGGCMLQEKLVAQASRHLIILACADKRCDSLLAQSVKCLPLEVHPFAVTAIQQRISVVFHGCHMIVREGSGKLGPVVTDSGNVILDLFFTTPPGSNQLVNTALLNMAGVLETGLFLDMHPNIITFTR